MVAGMCEMAVLQLRLVHGNRKTTVIVCKAGLGVEYTLWAVNRDANR